MTHILRFKPRTTPRLMLVSELMRLSMLASTAIVSVVGGDDYLVRFPNWTRCGRCDGTGHDDGAECPACHGAGETLQPGCLDI